MILLKSEINDFIYINKAIIYAYILTLFYLVIMKDL